MSYVEKKCFLPYSQYINVTEKEKLAKQNGTEQSLILFYCENLGILTIEQWNVNSIVQLVYFIERTQISLKNQVGETEIIFYPKLVEIGEDLIIFIDIFS